MAERLPSWGAFIFFSVTSKLAVRSCGDMVITVLLESPPIVPTPPKTDPPLSPPGNDRESWAAWRRQLEQSGIRRSMTGTARHGRWRAYDAMLAAIDLGLRIVGLHGRGRRNAADVALIELDLACPDLPSAFDGFRIVHVSDPHFDALPATADRAAALLSAIDADLCVLGGDYLMGHGGPSSLIEPYLLQILDAVRPRHGTVAILGNHDPADMVAIMERLNIAVLVNESMSLEQDGHHIHLTGTDDVHYFHSPAAHAALARAPEGFNIALVHSPELAAVAAGHGFHLYLCGHTHGGQICLPGGHPIVTHVKVHQEYARGQWNHDAMIGYTSAGLGVSGIPVRFNSRGEVTVVTLRRAAAV